VKIADNRKYEVTSGQRRLEMLYREKKNSQLQGKQLTEREGHRSEPFPTCKLAAHTSITE